MADAAVIGRGGPSLQPSLAQHQPVAGNSPLLAVKHQLEPIGEQRLEHQHQVMIAGRHGRLGFDIVAILIDPLGPSDDLGLRYVVSTAHAPLQRTFFALIRPLLSKMPTTLPGGSRLGLIDATSNAGEPAGGWAKSVA